MTDAVRAVISHPADLSSWGRRQLETPWFAAYLRKTIGDRRDGDGWEEFLDVGCCGDTLDVPLRLERLEGGDEVGPETDIAYEEREESGIRGGWRVQSAGGPSTG